MQNKVDIIYFGDLLDVNGVNFVTNSFLLGNKYFENQGHILNKIYGYDIKVDCSKQDRIPISHAAGKKTSGIAKLKILIKKVLFASFPLGIWVIFQKNFLNKAKAVIDEYKDDEQVQSIIFQDLYTAYFYYKRTDIKHKKSVLILHCGEHAYDQLFLSYPTLSKGRYKERLDEIRNFAFANVDQLVYLSKKTTLLNPEYREKTTFVYNGLEDISNLAFKNTGSVIEIISVASMNYRKGHEIIIEAVNMLDSNMRSKLKIHFVGGGAQEPELKQQVDDYKLGDVIQFLGVRGDVPQLLEKMDALMLVSKSEGLPLCIIEGLRQGLYIIGTDVGGVGEMLNPTFGELVDRDPKMLKLSLEKLITGDLLNDEAKILARRQYEEKFTLQRMVERYSEILKSIA